MHIISTYCFKIFSSLSFKMIITLAAVAALSLLIAVACISTASSACINRTNCSSCVANEIDALAVFENRTGYAGLVELLVAPSSSASSDCFWCSSTRTCSDSSDNCSQSCDDDEDDSVDSFASQLYSLLFIIGIIILTCISCGMCYVRRHADPSGLHELVSPLLNHKPRHDTLLRVDDSEWMCAICGFDNALASAYCVMCGTEEKVTDEYKAMKAASKSKKRPSRRSNNTTHPPPSAVDQDILIPEDAQVSSDSISMSLKYFSADADPSLSPTKRSEAINYRRLNQLNLRQKSARRRKMWQRCLDPRTGSLLWTRVRVQQEQPSRWDSDSQNTFSSVDDDPRAGIIPTRATSTNGRSDSNNNSWAYAAASAAPRADALMDLLSASRSCGPPSSSSSSVIGSSRQSLSPTRQRRSFDSFNDSVLRSHSPGFTSVLDVGGQLTWEKIESGSSSSGGGGGATITKYVSSNKASKPAHSMVRFQRLYQHPQPTLPLSVPRPTSACRAVDDSAADIEADAEAVTSPLLPIRSLHPDSSSTLMDSLLYSPEPQLVDLAGIAAMPFRSKQVWFLDRMAELQVPPSEGYIKIEVRRSKLLEDSHSVLTQFQLHDLHKYLRIEFHNEAGIDAGGLEREWFEQVTALLFAPEAGLFTSCGGSSSGAYHINPTSLSYNPRHLSYFKFIGRFIGKAIMGQHCIHAHLSVPLRKQMISMPITFSDLEFVDEELYRNLKWLKRSCPQVSSLMLDFSISYGGSHAGPTNGSFNTCTNIVSYDLKPGGSELPVTDDNKEEYLQLRLRHRMLDSIKPQLEHFLSGLYEVVPADLLSVFDYQELDLLLCGTPDIDLDDWMRNTEYLGTHQHCYNALVCGDVG